MINPNDIKKYTLSMGERWEAIELLNSLQNADRVSTHSIPCLNFLQV